MALKYIAMKEKIETLIVNYRKEIVEVEKAMAKMKYPSSLLECYKVKIATISGILEELEYILNECSYA